MSYKSSQTEQTSPHYDQTLHLHLHLHLRLRLRLHLRLHLQACAILRHWGTPLLGALTCAGNELTQAGDDLQIKCLQW